ncbi:hypothetical protein Nepgr_008081 [Nepenthes gracilis]|uniref:Uncharacterized protein n=1 Tax=Nepenthes gracilis TaxID=150966 RepID=A0AAD3XJ41_NEPGR|nr:hypothetical protein Nepgr_008081 [Nepenthes gracilis]
MKASLALFEKLGLYAGGVGCLPSAFDYSHDSAGWSTSMDVAAGIGALSVILSSWILEGRKCFPSPVWECVLCSDPGEFWATVAAGHDMLSLLLSLSFSWPGWNRVRCFVIAGVHPVELVVCTFEDGSLKAWARCQGLHCDLAGCIVLWLVDCAGCCPAELCSDLSASARGPGWSGYLVCCICLCWDAVISGGSPMNMPLAADQQCLQWPYELWSCSSACIILLRWFGACEPDARVAGLLFLVLSRGSFGVCWALLLFLAGLMRLAPSVMLHQHAEEPSSSLPITKHTQYRKTQATRLYTKQETTTKYEPASFPVARAKDLNRQQQRPRTSITCQETSRKGSRTQPTCIGQEQRVQIFSDNNTPEAASHQIYLQHPAVATFRMKVTVAVASSCAIRNHPASSTTLQDPNNLYTTATTQ